jgi:hypothetical protein
MHEADTETQISLSVSEPYDGESMYHSLIVLAITCMKRSTTSFLLAYSIKNLVAYWPEFHAQHATLTYDSNKQHQKVGTNTRPTS